MKVLITGSVGLIGHATSVRLSEHGWEVREIDIVPPNDHVGSDYHVCNIMDFDAVLEQVKGCDAIVHMAALRAPTLGTGSDVYRINTVGTFNVFEAAAHVGIRRIVQASSINAMGCAWNIGDFRPEYLPVDEAHPIYTNDPYSFSKQQIEDIAEYFWRRDKISSVGLRFPAVYAVDAANLEQRMQRYADMRQFLDRFVDLDEDEQQRQLSIAHQKGLEFRGKRMLEYPHKNPWGTDIPEGIDHHLWFAYVFDRYNLWASIDVRDAAQSIEKALTADFEGSHPLFVNDTHNTLNYDSHTLARIFFADVQEWNETVSGSETLISNTKARQLIGFEPEYPLYGGD